MSLVNLVVSETISQSDQIASGLLSLVQYINGGGEFFSHAVFSALASVAISSRLRDFIIAPSGEGIKELKRDIEQEIDKVTRSAQIDEQLRFQLKEHYKGCKDDTESLTSALRDNAVQIENRCHVWCYIAFGIIILSIASEWNKCLGALNLLCLLPILIARIRMGRVYKNANTKLEDLRKNFNNVRNVCQSQYEAEQEATDASIQKKLTPKRSAKRSTGRPIR